MIEAVVGGLLGVVIAIGGLVIFRIGVFNRIFGRVISANLFPVVDNTYVIFASYWVVPAGIVLSAAAAYVTLRLYVRQ